MSSGNLEGRKVLVVGASSGLGAATARAAAAAGADVVVSARRQAMLDEVVAEMGRGHAIAGDATVQADAKRVVDTAVEKLGGLDLVVYVAGYGVLQPLAETDPETWMPVYAVNVVGANMIAGAAIPHLSREGMVAFVSSRTVEDNNAYFASYGASKAALDYCIRTWGIEHPDRRFVRVMMGNCAPTEFANHMRPQLLTDALAKWDQQGVPGGVMAADDVAAAMIESLGVGLAHPELDMSELRYDARTDGGEPVSKMNPTKM